jgi:DNA-binding CsgD family transcriptional regulator/tetratricopeptide (TPR) repeat protein
VGRTDELGRIAAALADPPAMVLVEGEAGIGKSRLVQEFLASPACSQKVLVAGCPPFYQPCTLGAVVDALHPAAGDLVGLRLSPLAGALRPLFPEWAAELPAPPEPLEDATAARYRMYRALAELLEVLGVSVLVAEDVHWADEATLEFLLFLASRQPAQLSLAVTYRPEDVPDGSLLRRLSSRLPAGITCARITLGLLDAVQTGSLVCSMLDGVHVSEEFAGFLHARTGGLPLAIEESVRLLHERRDLARHDGGWVRRNLDRIAVPPTIRDAVLERTGRLDAGARAVVRAAAVLADPASEAVLLAVAGLSSQDAGLGLAAAIRCGLLAEDNRPRGPGLISFRHVLAAQAVYEGMTARMRRQLHLRAALALEGLPSPPVAQLARHFRAGGDTSDWCHYAEQAADLELASGGEVAAVGLLHDLIVNAGLPAHTVLRLTQKIPLGALTGYAQLRDLIRGLRSVLDGEALSSAERAEADCQLGQILLKAGDCQDGIAALERAIPGLDHRPDQVAHAMVALGWPGRTLWPADVHKRWLDQAASAVTDPSIPAADRLALAVDRVTALLDLGEESGWAAADALPEDAAAPWEIQHVARCCLNIGDSAMQWGRYEDSRRRLSSALRMTDRHDYPLMRDLTLVTLAHLDWFTGSWAGLAERTETLAGLDEPLIRLEAVHVSGALDMAAGKYRSAEEKLRLVLEEEQPRGGVYLPLETAATLARLRLIDGCPDDALALTDDPIRVITAKGIWLWATDVAPVRMQALTAAGRTAEAAKLITAFAEALRGRSALAPRAALAQCRAMLAESRGEYARAATLSGQAAAVWQALPRPYQALLARERQGHCLLGASQRDAGLAVLTEVSRGLSDLGATGDGDRVVRSLRGHGVTAWRGWRGGRRGYGGQLSPRELEAVRLLVAGHTSREIAQVLCRSPKTVNMQLSSAMRKLNVSSRTALALRVVEAGIAADAQPQDTTGSSAVAR